MKDLGAHVSAAGDADQAVHRAVNIGADALQHWPARFDGHHAGRAD